MGIYILPKIMTIFPHHFQFYSTCLLVGNNHINLREIVRNLLSLDKADGTEADEILREAQSSTLSNCYLHMTQLKQRDICLVVRVTVFVHTNATFVTIIIITPRSVNERFQIQKPWPN